MTKLTNVLAIAALTSVAFAPAAFAGDKMEKAAEPVQANMTVETPESRTIALRTEMEAEVRGAVARGDLIAVEGPDGRVYYNRYIPVSELPDPELDLRVIDTFEVSHEGRTYTNKVVQELN